MILFWISMYFQWTIGYPKSLSGCGCGGGGGCFSSTQFCLQHENCIHLPFLCYLQNGWKWKKVVFSIEQMLELIQSWERGICSYSCQGVYHWCTDSCGDKLKQKEAWRVCKRLLVVLVFPKLQNVEKSGYDVLDFIGLTKNKWKEYPKQGR